MRKHLSFLFVLLSLGTSLGGFAREPVDWPKLDEKLKNPTPAQRLEAIQAMSESGQRNGAELLPPLLSDSEQHVRSALKFIGGISGNHELRESAVVSPGLTR